MTGPAVASATPLDVVAEAAWLIEDLDLAAERRRRRRSRLRRTAMKVLGVAIFLLLWELAAYAVDDLAIFPTVQTTFHTFFTYLGKPYPAAGDPLWENLLVSARRIVIGFTAGVVVGVLVGSAMWAVRPVRELIDPVIELTRPLPPLAFIPLLIVWFGIGELPKEILIVVGVLPIMVVSTVAALDAVPAEYEQCARTLGASRWYSLLFVQIRAALPGVITGMRLSMGGAWTSIVAVEMIAATSGVGYEILQAGNYLLTPLVLSGIAAIGILGLIFDALLRGLLRLADPSLARAGD